MEIPDSPDGTDGTSTTNLVPNQLASLVTTFDPAKDDLTGNKKKVQLLMNMWLDGKMDRIGNQVDSRMLWIGPVRSCS